MNPPGTSAERADAKSVADLAAPLASCRRYRIPSPCSSRDPRLQRRGQLTRTMAEMHRKAPGGRAPMRPQGSVYPPLRRKQPARAPPANIEFRHPHGGLTHSGTAAVDLQIAGPRTLQRAAGDVETIQELGGKPPGNACIPSTHY